MSAIEIQGLTKDYGNGKGIFDLTFSIDEGEVFGYLGPNGAGKTTTIRHLMGFLRPQKGSCRIGGLDCGRDAARIQENLGYIPGEIAFFDEMSGQGFLRFVADYRGLSSTTRIKELSDFFELDPRGKLKKMSKGTKQKIGIVCAFLHDPAILILDEPTSGLDPLMQNRFVELIRVEQERGKTILMSSHMFEEVERTCGRVGIIRNGRLAAVDGVEALKQSQSKRYLVTFRTPEAAASFQKEGFQAAGLEGARLTVSVQNNLNAFLSALARYDVASLDSVSQSLEDIFLHFYGGENHD